MPIAEIEPNLCCPDGNVLNHPVGQQLTRLLYFYDRKTMAHPYHFNRQVIEFLKSRNTLLDLSLYNYTARCLSTFPEMLEPFQNEDFPRLKCLLLFTTIFSHRELLAWGTRGAWDDLENLGTLSTQQLLAFVGATPRLRVLSYTFHDRYDTQQTEDQLVRRLERYPLLGLCQVIYIWYRTQIRLPRTRRSAPWPILETSPGILDIDITHRGSSLNFIDPPTFEPRLEEICRIRMLCTNLRKFQLRVEPLGDTVDWP